MDKKTHKVCVQLTEETYEALRRRAEQSRRNDPNSNATIGHVTRVAIERDLSRDK